MLTLIRSLGVACLALVLSAGLAHAVDIDVKNSDGSKTTLRSQGTGAAAVGLAHLLGCEHADPVEALGYCRVTGAVVIPYTAMTGVTTNTTSATFTLPSGGKTPMASVTGTGAVTATLKLYGDMENTVTHGKLLSTITLTDTTKDVDIATQFTADYPYYHATSENVTGTGATVEFIIATGIAGSGSSSGGGGEVTNAGTFVVQIDGAGLTALQAIDNIVSGSGVNVSQINGVTPLMGAGGTGTGSHRTTEANDSQLSADVALIKGASVAEDTAHSDTERITKNGCRRNDNASVSAATDGDWSTLDCNNLGALRVSTIDPCTALAKTHIVINISSATTTELTPSLAGASTNWYVCAIDIITAAANNVALVDDNSDGCGTPTAGLAGGVTAATGWNFAANGGIVKGNGAATVFKTVTSNSVLCLMTSANTQLSGSIQVVSAP